MFCPKCGKSVEQGSKYCGYCGSDLSKLIDIREAKLKNARPEKKGKRKKYIILVSTMIILILGAIGTIGFLKENSDNFLGKWIDSLAEASDEEAGESDKEYEQLSDMEKYEKAAEKYLDSLMIENDLDGFLELIHPIFDMFDDERSKRGEGKFFLYQLGLYEEQQKYDSEIIISYSIDDIIPYDKELPESIYNSINVEEVVKVSYSWGARLANGEILFTDATDWFLLYKANEKIWAVQ